MDFNSFQRCRVQLPSLQFLDLSFSDMITKIDITPKSLSPFPNLKCLVVSENTPIAKYSSAEIQVIRVDPKNAYIFHPPEKVEQKLNKWVSNGILDINAHFGDRPWTKKSLLTHFIQTGVNTTIIKVNYWCIFNYQFHR